MKQKITKTQFNELSQKAKERLSLWWATTSHHPKAIDTSAGYKITTYKYPIEKRKKVPLLIIGYMIEFIKDHTDHECGFKRSQFTEMMIFIFDSYEHTPALGLCNELWGATKAILEKD